VLNFGDSRDTSVETKIVDNEATTTTQQQQQQVAGPVVCENNRQT
jgi:hypothetical protein